MRPTKKLIDFKEEILPGWKMLSDQEIKGTSFGEFSIENGVGMSPFWIRYNRKKYISNVIVC
jgi:hypothetical protein